MTPEELDEWARENEFLILVPGQSYQRQLYQNGGSLFMYIMDGEKWTTVYNVPATEKNPGKTNVKCQNVSLERAIKEATSFIEWTKEKNRGSKRRTN